MNTTHHVTVKPVDGRRFHKGVSAIKNAQGKYDASSKTWAITYLTPVRELCIIESLRQGSTLKESKR